MDRSRFWAWARLLAGAAILAVLAVRLGSQPFVDGLRHTDALALAVALAVTAVTTACNAHRWSLLAEGLDVGLPFRDAFRACYRAQLLNATLPGGVLGDVHRGYRHGRHTGAMGRGFRSVLWDRGSGQVVQALIAVAALPLLLGSRDDWAIWLPAGVFTLAGVLLLLPRRFLEVVADEVHTVLGGVWPRIALLSAVTVAGHVTVFVVAARSAGVDVPLHQLVPLALLVLLASAIPLNVAGWGPREGAAAWAFGAAGFGAAAGLEVAVVYGVVSLVATLPGILVLRGASQHREPAHELQTAGGGVAWVSGPTSS